MFLEPVIIELDSEWIAHRAGLTWIGANSN